jgi:hypothetical protein
VFSVPYFRKRLPSTTNRETRISALVAETVDVFSGLRALLCSRRNCVRLCGLPLVKTASMDYRHGCGIGTVQVRGSSGISALE